MAFQVLLQPTSKPYSGMYHKQTNKNNKKVNIITMPRFKLGTSLTNARKVTTDLSCSITGNKLDLGER
jgi:hypothetical protein